MTNYEKNKELLDMYAVANVHWGVKKDGKVFECDFCNRCIFREDGPCTQKKLQWLQEEYKEPEVDWGKVPIDTPILVRNSGYYEWEKRYFAGFIHGKLCAFGEGDTSKNFDCISSWDYAKLDEEDGEE